MVTLQRPERRNWRFLGITSAPTHMPTCCQPKSRSPWSGYSFSTILLDWYSHYVQRWSGRCVPCQATTVSAISATPVFCYWCGTIWNSGEYSGAPPWGRGGPLLFLSIQRLFIKNRFRAAGRLPGRPPLGLIVSEYSIVLVDRYTLTFLNFRFWLTLGVESDRFMM